MDLNEITHDYDHNAQVDSTEFIDQNYFNYQILPKTNLSAGLSLGYVSVSKGSNQVFEQGLVRTSYDTGHRISGNIFGGVEFRQFSGGGDSVVNPVFGLQAVYSPMDGTTLTLAGSRLVTTSAEYIGQNIVTTGVSLTASQLFYEKITASVKAGYENYDYGSAGDNGGAVQRTDDALRFGASAAFHVTPHLGVNLAYDYWHYASTARQFRFDDDRVSIYLDFLF